MKVVINRKQMGMFCLSAKAEGFIKSLKKLQFDFLLSSINKKGDCFIIPDGYFNRIERNDPDLLKAIETLGEEANTPLSILKIVEIPDDVEFEIENYNGMEWVSEKHRTWC